MRRIQGHYSFSYAIVTALVLWSVSALAADTFKITATYGDGTHPFHLATGSPGELGLLQALAQAFAKQTPSTLLWVKAGSGASLDLLKNRRVDMVMVHAPAAEKKAVEAGWAVMPTLVGSNEFYIVGPIADPADIKHAQSAADAYQRIAKAQAPFITRADNSGTNKKELQIWKKAGIEPQGEWYIPTHDFMTASLKKADEVDGYFMTDSSTWVAEKANVPKLTVLFRGDQFLVNTYHALVAPEGATEARDTAAAFVEFVGSEAGQRIIGEYGKDRYGESLYQDAAYAKQFVE
ncbi:MAG: substrate-binding domain-containing protein [Gammaproteobacteria bacterium]|nr:substrate-binding domain-containing protein [Gammaproteobacteria bacterium]MCP5423900.1 substrate-binding domain-containing protein [Gammaproteobacteria bacterium]